MTYFIYDAAVLAVLLLFVWLGYRKGLVLTLCSLLAFQLGGKLLQGFTFFHVIASFLWDWFM